MALDALLGGTRRIVWWRSAAKPWHECNRPCSDSEGQVDFIALPGLDSSRLVCLRNDRPEKASAATAVFRELFPLARAWKPSPSPISPSPRHGAPPVPPPIPSLPVPYTPGGISLLPLGRQGGSIRFFAGWSVLPQIRHTAVYIMKACCRTGRQIAVQSSLSPACSNASGNDILL